MTDVTADAERRCLHCNTARAKLQRCGGCRRVYFCDRDCQVRVWRQHRPHCSLDPANAPAAVAAAAAAVPTAVATQTQPLAAASVTPTSTSPPSSLPSALHTKPHASPKTVRLITEPVEVLELAPTASTHTSSSTSSSPSPTSATPSNKKKKKHKKKKRANSLHAPASAPIATQSNPKSRSTSFSTHKHVAWGDVHAREYERFPGGGGAVPYDGTWALGLGAPVADVELGSVVQVDAMRAQELASRIQELPKSQRALVRAGETRQFDYCRGAANPLFARLSERERKQIFTATRAVDIKPQDDPAVGNHKAKDATHYKRKSSLPLSTSPTLTPQLRRLSIALSDLDGSEPEDLAAPDFACVSIEQLDEFAKIRDSRDVACGCSCGDLVKKVAKMHVKRLIAFLTERDVALPAKKDKSALLALAKAVAAREQNCATARDCECNRNGVGCHANVCDGCVGDCFNPFETYMYDKRAVMQYRKAQLAKWQQAQHANDTTSDGESEQPMENNTLSHPQHSPISVV